MKKPYLRCRNALAAAGCALALAVAPGPLAPEARAQQPVAPPSGPGWYGYVPGRGWVAYAPNSPSAPVSGTAATSVPASPPASGWYGYAPAAGWTGYAPASSPIVPAVRPAPRRVLPADGSRRRAANSAVNHIAPQLSYTIPAHREYGTGRPIPLAKPWLPPSP